MWRKIKIIIACCGTVISIAIIFSILLILLGLEERIELFFYLHFTVGTVIIFFIFWPFYSKRLK